jgi:hypothetical protein
MASADVPKATDKPGISDGDGEQPALDKPAK